MLNQIQTEIDSAPEQFTRFLHRTFRSAIVGGVVPLVAYGFLRVMFTDMPNVVPVSFITLYLLYLVSTIRGEWSLARKMARRHARRGP